MRAGHLLGFLATTPSTKAVIAGPLVVAPGLPRPAIVMMRLIEAYEVILAKAGIRAYLFHVETGNPGWRTIVEEAGHEPFSTDATGAWYQRKVASYGQPATEGAAVERGISGAVSG
jgi:hypothetical protein